VVPRRDLLVVLLLVGMAARIFWLATVTPAPGIDYYQFWLVGQGESRTHIENIYSPEGREILLQVGKEILAETPQARRLAAAVDYRRNIETFSTPFLYLAVRSISRGVYGADLKLFQGLGLACVGLAVVLLCRMSRYDWTTTLLILLMLLLCSDPLVTNAQVGNVNGFQLAAIALYAWLLRGPPSIVRQAIAGVLMGALIMFKPTLGLVFPFVCIGWVAERQWHRLLVQCVAVAAGVSLAVVSSSFFLGSPGAWMDWLAALPNLEEARERSVRLGNFCLSRLASELGAPDLSSPLLVVTVLATASVIWLASHQRRGVPVGERAISPGSDWVPSEDREYLAVALGCAISVVALRLVWMHYYLLLTPLAIYLFRPRSTEPTRDGSWRQLELPMICIAIVGILGGPMRLLLFGSSVQIMAGSFVVGAVTLLIFGLVELYRLRPWASPDSPSELSP
jgi:hypothetical protein